MYRYATVHITVTPVNDPPTLAPIAAVHVPGGAAVALDTAGAAADPDPNDVVRLIVTAPPRLGSLAVEGLVAAAAAGYVVPAGAAIYYTASAAGLEAAAATPDGVAADVIGLAASDGHRLSEERFVNVVISKHGVASGAVLSGHAGHALYLPGTGVTPLVIPVHSKHPIGNTLTAKPFTLELWIRKQTAATDAVLLTLGPPGESTASTLSVSRAGHLRLHTPAGAIAATGMVLHSAGWAHVAAVYDGDLLWLIVDGALAATEPAMGAARGKALPLNPIVVGGGQGGGDIGPFFHGWVDELRIWGTARTAAEVGAQMNAALSGDEPGLIKYVPVSSADLPAEATSSAWKGPKLALSTAPISTFAAVTDEDVPVKIALRAAASPGHARYALTKAIITTLPKKGVLVDALGGVVTAAPYTLPTPEVTFQPAKHGCGAPHYASFKVASGDGLAASLTSTVTVSVASVPDEPSVDPTPAGAAATTAPKPYVFTLVARDGDILSECVSSDVRVRVASLPEIGALHQVAADGVKPGALISAPGTALSHATTDVTTGVVTVKVAYVPVDDYSAAGYAPGATAKGAPYTATFTYLATDGVGAAAETSAAETATITVSQAPAVVGSQLTVPILLASSVDGEKATGTGGSYNVAGHAAMFDGLDDAVAAVFPPALAGSFTSFTVETWFKATSAAHGGAALFVLPGTAALHLQHFGGLALQVRSTLGRTLQASTPAAPNDGAWHHVAAEYDAAAERVRVYLDGALAGAATHAPLQRSDIFGSVSGPSLLYVGGDGSAASSHCFRGQMDEARVWSSAIAPSRASLRANTAAGTEPGLVAYFRFDVEPGSTPASAAVRDFGPHNLTAGFVGSNSDGRASVVASTAPVVRWGSAR